MRIEAEDIAAVVKQVLATIQDNEQRIPADRFAYPEKEAARLLSLEPHVLGDMRRRGEIVAVKCGKQYRYSRQTLLDFLNT